MKRLLVILVVALWASAAVADEFADQLLSIQHRWAEIQYQLPEKQREAAFEQLVAEVTSWREAHPQRAEAWIWQGIVLSTYAGAKGGLGALSLVGDAREALEQALALDETALAGSAHTSLGSLYYQVPGWPLSFGDDEEAQNHLQAALRLNPDGIDPNYFYGDYLMQQGEPERARTYLERALLAPARPDRPQADAGRRQEIQARLDELMAR